MYTLGKGVVKPPKIIEQSVTACAVKQNAAVHWPDTSRCMGARCIALQAHTNIRIGFSATRPRSGTAMLHYQLCLHKEPWDCGKERHSTEGVFLRGRERRHVS